MSRCHSAPRCPWKDCSSSGSVLIAWVRVTTRGQKKSPQLKWGTLYSFGFEANVAPSAVGAMTAHLGIWERGGELTVGIMGPSAP